MDTKSLLASFKGAWSTLPNSLGPCSKEEFRDLFRILFSSEEACQATAVVYVWFTDKAVPRLQGQSNVLYVGQTIQTLSERHRRYAARETSDYNWPRYEFVIPRYGSIVVMYAEAAAIGGTPKEAEKKLLDQYFEDHLEYPPFNR